MSTIVGVKFKDLGKVYYFSPKKLQLAVGDGVIVETARGLEYGVVEIANTEIDDSQISGELKKVVRKATDKDVQQHLSNLEKRPRFIREAQELANKYNLDMKVVDAELAFDGSKALFYFTSDNRVDFRELVKDMAGAFRMRIELRQIGIRDECKMKGGLGPCGRVCCCNAYMNEFARVSIKMANTICISVCLTAPKEWLFLRVRQVLSAIQKGSSCTEKTASIRQSLSTMMDRLIISGDSSA